jgi:TolB protein
VLFSVNTAAGREGRYTVVRIRDLETGEEREVAQSGGVVGVSPDGRQLANEVGDPVTKEGVVKIVPVAGGEPREVFRTKKAGMSLSWNADGRHVLVGESDPDNEVLWLVRVDGAKPLKFTLGTKGVLGPRLHPDGRQVAFYTRSEGKGEVWVMENFLPAAKEAGGGPTQKIKKIKK